MHEVVVRYKWTADELLDAYHWHHRHGARRFYLVLVWALILCLVGVGLLCLVVFHDGSGWVALGLGVFLLLVHKLIQPWLIRHQFDRRPDKGIDVECRISADGVRQRTELGASDISWKAFSQIVQAPGGYLFYPNRQMFYWLPKHGFQNQTEYENLAELIRRHSSLSTIG